MCGPFTIDSIKSTTPPNYIDDEMGGDFKFETNSTHSIFMVNPEVSKDEIGLYVFTTKICLQNYPSICKNLDSNFEITPCAVSRLNNFI